MAEASSDPDSPPHGAAWNGTALAAGAGVLAGLLLGHKGAAGLAAGVAAAASVKLLSSTSRGDEPTPDVSLLQSIATVPHTSTPVLQKDPGDWVDSDAVLFGHVIPDPVMAVQMLKEKALPLLDDDGLPVDEVTVRPQYPEELKDDFPSGPIIWEPGRFVQSRSDGAGETVWFSLQDMIREATKLAETTEVQPETIAPVLFPAPAEVPFSAPAVELPEAHSAPFSTPAPLLSSPLPSAFTPSELAPEMSPFTPLLQGDAAEPNSEGPVAFITPKPFQGNAQPQPRPFHLTGAEAVRPGLLTGGPSVFTTDLAPAHGTSRVGVHTRAMRQLEPVAPVISEKRSTSWALVLMSCVMIVVGLFLAADWWSDGELRRRFQNVSWMKSLDQPAKAPSASHMVPTGHLPVLAPGTLTKPN